MYCLHTRSQERPYVDNLSNAPRRQDPPQRPPRQLRYVITCHADTLGRRVLRQLVRQASGDGRGGQGSVGVPSNRRKDGVVNDETGYMVTFIVTWN